MNNTFETYQLNVRMQYSSAAYIQYYLKEAQEVYKNIKPKFENLRVWTYVWTYVYAISPLHFINCPH